MDEDDIELIDEWFNAHVSSYGTYHSDNEYSVCADDIDEFSDFLRENFPDMVGIRCCCGTRDSGIWFFRDDLEQVRFC